MGAKLSDQKDTEFEPNLFTSIYVYIFLNISGGRQGKIYDRPT